MFHVSCNTELLCYSRMLEQESWMQGGRQAWCCQDGLGLARFRAPTKIS